MTSYLLITESPAKAKKIQGFLGSNYKVLSSCGHIRDLEKKRKQNNMVIQKVLVLMLKIILNLNML